MWRLTDDGPVAVPFTALASERRLEDMLVAEPTLIGVDLLVVGRQVPTEYGGYIDVLALDADGFVHVLELKRDRTPREVVAQALDYGSWVADLTLDDLAALYDGDVAANFADHFGTPLPDVVNAEHRLTIVASELDPASERIITYLAERFGVPVNARFFQCFTTSDGEYLIGEALVDTTPAEPRKSRSASKVRPWNGRDWYCSVGSGLGEDRWTTARRYGFVGAGGGAWFSKPLRNLQPGHRVFAYVGGAGYVGVGKVIAPVVRLRDLVADLDGGSVKVVDQPDLPNGLRERAHDVDDDITEWTVPVRWLGSVPVEEAINARGLFAKQHSACRLTDENTIAYVAEAFGVGEES